MLEPRRLLSATGLAFASPVAYPVGAQPGFIVTADLAADGKTDIITGNDKGKISVLMGNGNGTFANVKSYPDGLTSGPATVTVADFNNDGFPDLLITNGSPQVSLMLGNGNGTFQAPQIMTLASNVVGALAADFNNDNIPDLVFAETGGNEGSQASVNLLINTGDGTFHDPLRVFTATAVSTLKIAAGKFTNDGNEDLAISTGEYGVVTVLLGEGNGNFELPSTVAVKNKISDLEAVDLNGDGMDDLLAFSNYSGVPTFTPGLNVLLSNGDGKFHAADFIPTQSTLSFTTADLNGDGNQDLLFFKYDETADSDSIAIKLGDGNGTFSAGYSSTLSFPSHVGISALPATADVDGTGRPSLLVGAFTTAMSGLTVSHTYFLDLLQNYTLGDFANPAGANPTITLSNGAVTATGTSLDDAAGITVASDQLTVQIDGTTQSFSLESVNSITINLGAGNDSLTIGAGVPAVTVKKSGGNDSIAAHNSADDTLNSGAGADSIKAISGNDLIVGGNGNETITAGNGNDTIRAGLGANSITAGNGSDVILALGSGNTIAAGTGNDTIVAGKYSTVTGGGGDDLEWALNGHDTLIGNIGDLSGTDSIYTSGAASDSVQLGADDLLNPSGRRRPPNGAQFLAGLESLT
jgi:hypothetical protein